MQTDSYISIPQGPIEAYDIRQARYFPELFQFHKVRLKRGHVADGGTEATFQFHKVRLKRQQLEHVSAADVISIPQGPIEACRNRPHHALAGKFQFHKVRLKRRRPGRAARRRGYFNSTRSD